MAAADSSFLGMNPSTGVTATSSATSDSLRVEVRIVRVEAPSELAASCQTRSKPLSPFRSTSTRVTSGSSSRTRARASAPVDAIPTTASPWASRSFEAASRKRVESSTSRQRGGTAHRVPHESSSVMVGSRNTAAAGVSAGATTPGR